MAKLEGYGKVRGLIFGAFGEASEGVHDLVQARGNGSTGGKGVLLGQVSEERGKGTAAATKKRQTAVLNVVRLTREREAQRLVQLQRKKVVRRGQFLLN